MKEREERLELFDKMGEIVSKKLERIAVDNGSLTRSAVKTMFENEFSSFKTSITTEISASVVQSLSAYRLQPDMNSIDNSVEEREQSNGKRDGKNKMYSYSRRFFCVPKKFAFPADV